jgi:hypothetical protein
MTEPEKRKVTYPLPQEVLADRKGGYFPSVEILNNRCKNNYGQDVFYDSTSDCCVRWEDTSKPKSAETGRYFFIKWGK